MFIPTEKLSYVISSKGRFKSLEKGGATFYGSKKRGDQDLSIFFLNFPEKKGVHNVHPIKSKLFGKKKGGDYLIIRMRDQIIFTSEIQIQGIFTSEVQIQGIVTSEVQIQGIFTSEVQIQGIFHCLTFLFYAWLLEMD